MSSIRTVGTEVLLGRGVWVEVAVFVGATVFVKVAVFEGDVVVVGVLVLVRVSAGTSVIVGAIEVKVAGE